MEEHLKPTLPPSFNEGNGNNSEEAQRLLPSDIANLLHGGVAAAKSGDKELARILFLKVTSFEPKNETAWLWMASISEQANERLDFLQKVLAINPTNERALSWLKLSKEHIARTLIQKGADAAKDGNKASAIHFLLQAVDYEPENEIAWMWLASLADLPEDKLAYLQRILNINPENEQVREMFETTKRHLARSLAQKGIEAANAGDKKVAADILQDVLDYDPNLEEVWLLRAYVSDSFEEKESYFKKVLEVNPNNLGALSGLSAVQEQLEAKNTWCCMVCQTKDQTPFDICPACSSLLNLDDIDMLLANQHVNESLIREGIQKLKRSFKDEISSNEYYKLGLAYLNLKDLKESIAFFQAALRLDPDDEVLASKVDYLTHRRNNIKQADESVFFATPELADLPEPSFDALDLHKEDLTPQEETEASLQQAETVPSMSVEEINAQIEETVAMPATPMDALTQHYAPTTPTMPLETFVLPTIAVEQKDESVNQEVAQQIDTEENSVEQTHELIDAVAEEQSAQVEAESLRDSEDAHGWPMPEDQEVETAPLSSEFVTDVEVVTQDEDISEETAQEMSEEDSQQTSDSLSVIESVSEPEVSSEPELLQAFEVSSEPEPFEVFKEQEESQQLASPAFFEESVDESQMEQPAMETSSQASDVETPVVSIDTPIVEMSVESQPQLQPTPKPAEAFEAPISQKKDTGKVVMVVDDSPTVRKLVSLKLEKFGHSVISAVDGMDALAKMSEETPDLILLDITMPRLDGYQLCKLIKGNESTKHVPVVMLSGKDGFFDKIRGRMAGASTYLTKPFEPEVLLQTVNDYCGIKSN